MGKRYESIDPNLAAWLSNQPLFFVATAPSGDEGLINHSPKGGAGTFRVLGPTRVAYLDMTGSGIETIAHLKQNGRITLMFNAFTGPPKIVRLFGTGSPMVPEDQAWPELIQRFNPSAEVRNLLRAIIVVDVARIQDSCGFVVPEMTVVKERNHLYRWANEQERKNGSDWDTRYRQAKNRFSIEGLPGLDLPEPDIAETSRNPAKGAAL